MENIERGSRVLVVDRDGERKVGFVWTASNYATEPDNDWYVEWYDQKDPEWKGYHYTKQQIDHAIGFIFNYDPEQILPRTRK